VVQGCRDDGAGVRAKDVHTGSLARDLPETALHAASRRSTTRSSIAPRTCTVVWPREVLRGVANNPRIDGKDGVAGSIPAGGSTPNQQARPGPAPGLSCARSDPKHRLPAICQQLLNRGRANTLRRPS
jgi:hypothetical protein